MKAILWDMDGTLVDSEPLWGIATAEMSREMGRTLTPEVRALTIGGTTAETVRTVARHAGIDLDDRCVASWTTWMLDRVTDLIRDSLGWRPGAQRILDACASAGVPCALVTNTARRLTDVTLETIGPERFVLTLCGDEVTHGKPAPDLYLEAARRLGVDPGDCLVVEDSANGMRAARDAGCRLLGVPEEGTVVSGGVTTLGELLPGHRDLTDVTLDDLRAVWARLGAGSGHETMAPVKNFESLFEELSQRAKDRPEGSGTVAALDAGVHFQGKKIVEEAGEVWLAAEYQSDDELSEEISQLIYWLQVVMVGRGLTPEDIYRHL